MEIFTHIISPLIGFALVYFTVPSAILFFNSKGIGTLGNPQIKTTEPPNIGGVPFFFSIIVSTILATFQYDFHQLKMWIAGSIILLFYGLKGDIFFLSWNKKILIEIIVAFLLTVYGQYRLNFIDSSWYDLSTLTLIDYILSIICFVAGFQLFSLLQKNESILIGVSITLLALFCLYFYNLQLAKYTILCLSTLGSLCGFLYFRFGNKKNKIALGESGTLILSLTITILAMKFCELYFNLQ